MQETKSALSSRFVSLTSDRTMTRVFWISTFAILTTIGALIEIPFKPVPLTLQTFFVLLSGAFLGKRDGFLSMSLYLLIGLAGLPVFSHFGFGFAKIIGPTGGYLLSFPIAAFLVGYLVSINKKRVFVLLSMFAGLIVIFTFGTIQLNLVYFHNWSESFKSGFLIFSWWDVVKLLAASSIYSQFLKR